MAVPVDIAASGHEQWLLFLFIVLIGAGFIVAPIIAVVAAGDFTIEPPKPPLTRFDEFAGRALRGIAAAVLIIEVAVQFGIVVPAERFRWLDRGTVIAAAVILIFAGDQFRDIPAEETADGLRKRRWWAFGLSSVALAVFVLTALRVI
jgi:hypothetical protein